MRVLTYSYLGNQCTKSEAAGWKCWALTSFYFESCIWPEAILRGMTANVHQILCKSRKHCDGDPGNDCISVWGKSMSRTRRIKTPRDRRKARQVKRKVKSMLIIFFDIKGIVHKEFALAGQTVISAYCCDDLR
jgi:hypothetical protein